MIYSGGRIFLDFPGDSGKLSINLLSESKVYLELIVTYNKGISLYIDSKIDLGKMISDILMGFSSAIFPKCKSFTKEGENFSFVKSVFPILKPDG